LICEVIKSPKIAYDKIMKKIKEAQKTLREIRPILKKRFNVNKIGVFGSFARGEEKRTSDLDILVEFYAPVGLFSFIELENFLKERLGIKVDLVMKDSLRPQIKKRIIKETIYA